MTSTILRHREKDHFFGKDCNPNNISDLYQFLETQEMSYGVQLVQSTYDWKGDTRRAEGEFHIVRDSDGQHVSPHTVSKGYSVITPNDMAEELIPFIDQGFAKPAAAFQLKGGYIEVISLLLDPGQLPKEIAEDENIRWFLMAKNYHGRSSAECAIFGERQICTNGMTALSKQHNFKISHRGNAADRYKRAVREFEGIKKVIGEMTERMGLYMDVPLSHIQAEMLADTVVGFNDARDSDFKPSKIDRTKDGDMSGQQRSLHAALMDAFSMPKMGTEGKTALDFYNGVTWVGTHWTPERSKLTDNDITESLLTGTRGKREVITLNLLDDFIASR